MRRFLLIFSKAELPGIYEMQHIRSADDILSLLDLKKNSPGMVLSDKSCHGLAETVQFCLNDFFPNPIKIPDVRENKLFFNVLNEIANSFKKNETELAVLINHWKISHLLSGLKLESQERYEQEQYLLCDLDNAQIVYSSPVFAKA